ncbi:MAG: LysR family transcriptional regulator [Alphaproteobacteria bacterium]
MDLRQARTFVAVVDLGTVSKAAVRLGITQPALSRQIGALERSLGLKLFDRVGRRLLLTSEGEQLLGDCRRLLGLAGALGERAQLLRRGDTGMLRVAASPQYIEGVFADFLHLFGRRFPAVQVKLFDVLGPDMLTMLERGEIHLGQSLAHAIAPDDDRFGSLALQPVEALAASARSLPLGDGRTIDIGALAPHPLLLLDPAFVVRRTFDAACRLARVKPNVLIETRAPHTLLALAEAGHGVAIIPWALQTHRYDVRITRVTYRGQPLREPLTILWDKRRPLPRYAVEFSRMLAQHVRHADPAAASLAARTRTGSGRAASGSRKF